MNTNGLNEELGRHRGKNNDWQCKICGDECVNVVRVVLECPVYDTIRNTFVGEVDNLLKGLKSLVHSIIFKENRHLGVRIGTGMILRLNQD